MLYNISSYLSIIAYFVSKSVKEFSVDNLKFECARIHHVHHEITELQPEVRPCLDFFSFFSENNQNYTLTN